MKTPGSDRVVTALARPASGEPVSVLRADRELGDALTGERLAEAERRSTATGLRRPAGNWDVSRDADLARGGLGLLVIDGTLVRRVGDGDRFVAELLSGGDLLQPAVHDDDEALLPFRATWRVLAPVHLAVLDAAWLRRMAPFPEVTAALSARLLVRSRRLVAQLAIVQRHRLDERLLLLFWELAGRYGRVGPTGTRLDLPLTHELISHLVGAHRPSVSVALGRLERDGRLSRRDGRWVLPGPPPQAGDGLLALDRPA